MILLNIEEIPVLVLDPSAQEKEAQHPLKSVEETEKKALSKHKAITKKKTEKPLKSRLNKKNIPVIDKPIFKFVKIVQERKGL